MKRILRFWKIVIFDTIGILLMILAILTGWLPGPGGIPLFIIGLGILAIHHEWAQKYIDMLKDGVEKLGKRIFTDNKNVQLGYDLVSPILLAIGVYFLWQHAAIWQITAGILTSFTALTLLLGNRERYDKVKKLFRKHKN